MVLLLFTADGIKLRASKNETNGTVKPADTHPVSKTHINGTNVCNIFDKEARFDRISTNYCMSVFLQQMAVLTNFIFPFYTCPGG